MPAQLRQIILVFLGVTALFLILRSFLVDDSFGQYGHYRGDSLGEVKAQTVKYLKDESCADCHQDITDLAIEGLHDKVGCQICHGPGYLHQDTTNYVKMDVVNTRNSCGSCHSFNPTRAADAIVMVDLKDHNVDDNKCTNCHNPHQPWLNLE